MPHRALLPVACAILIASPCLGQRAYRPTASWQTRVSAPDRLRLRQWRDTWITALAAARADGHQPQILAAGALLDPDVALPDLTLPDGAYRCRTTKLGTQAIGGATFLTMPEQSCRIGAGGLIVDSGMQRPAGRLLPFDNARLIFLGAMALGDERRALDYGRDDVRDMVGIVERIGPRRWRLVIPRPRWQSQIDVMEILPRDPE